MAAPKPKYTDADIDFMVRYAGSLERTFAAHLAAHAVVENALRGRISHTIDLHAPCPYCGKLPPVPWVPV